MRNIEEIVRIGPVIPVLTFDSVEQGEEVSKALYAGDLRVFEITLRTDAALDVIHRVSRQMPDVVIGAGTLTHPAQIAAAKAAGAQFGVSPGFSRELHAAAQQAGLPLMPGVMTPSDILAAMDCGCRIVKFFPAEQAGGVPMLKAFAGPFAQMHFCPTGGITPKTAPDYLALPNVVCIGGSWLVPKDAVADREWDEITRQARAASQLA